MKFFIAGNFAANTPYPFSENSRNRFTDLDGVEDVASLIKSGGIGVSSVPVMYIVRDGQELILNTRSAAALTIAGAKRANWNAVNVTGNEFFENLLSGQLQRNGLTNAGTSVTSMGGQNGSTSIGADRVYKPQ